MGSKGGTVLGGNDFNLLKEVMLFKSILYNPIFQKERLLLERHGVFKRDL